MPAWTRRLAARLAGDMPAVKVLVQRPGDPDWITVPLHRDPAAWERLDAPDGICAVNVQGVIFEGFTRIDVEALGGGTGGVRVTVHGDRPAIWEFLPLAPDPQLGGAINTRQTRRELYDAQSLPFGFFFRARPGARATEEQRASRSVAGWRDFTEHLPAKELDEAGRLLPQRPQGRYSPSEHTRTYYLTQEDSASTASPDPLEASATRSDFGSSKLAIDRQPGVLSHTWDLTAGEDSHITWNGVNKMRLEPNSKPWQGTVRVQLDCVLIGANISYGFRQVIPAGSIDGGHIRISEDGATIRLEAGQDEAAFTGTGLKLSTSPWGSTTGDQRDTVAARLRVANAGVTTQSIRLRFGRDSFYDGPWASHAAREPLALLGVGH